MGKKHNESMNFNGSALEGQDFGPHGQLIHHFPLMLVQFVQNERAVEAFQIVKHHENLTLLVPVRYIHEIIQIVQKVQGTILTLQHMDGLFLRRRITQQVSDKDPLSILHGLEIRVNKQGRGWRHLLTSPLLGLFMLLFLHHGLNVKLMVMDGHLFLTHGTFGVPALVASVGNDRVLGLALERGFDRLTLLGDHMMAFAIGTVKLAMTQGAILRGPGTTHITLTLKSATRGNDVQPSK